MSERRLCKDCRHIRRVYAFHTEVLFDICDTAPVIVDSPIHGEQGHAVRALVRNKNFDCSLFQPYVPPRPWWAFWRKP